MFALFSIFLLMFAELADIEPRKLLSIPLAARRIGVGRTKLYELIAEGLIPTVRVGPKRRLVPVEALDAYADSLQREHSTARAAEA